MSRNDTVSSGPRQDRGQRRGELSRRAVVGGASTLLVATLAIAGSASGSCDDVAGRRAPDAEDAGLSAVFLANARGFYDAALAGRARFPRQAARFLAIAIELSLKSYLLHRDFSDDWNRVHLGHDLSKALSCAQSAGFHGAPAGLPIVAAFLSPYYMRYAFQAVELESLAALDAAHPYDAVGSLLDEVWAATQGNARRDGSIPTARDLRS